MEAKAPALAILLAKKKPERSEDSGEKELEHLASLLRESEESEDLKGKAKALRAFVKLCSKE